MRHRLSILLLIIFSVCMEAGHAFAAEGEGLQVRIDVKGVTDTIISGHLVGTNLHVGYERDIDTAPKKNQFLRLIAGGQVALNPDLVKRCRDASIRILRFPGGCTSDAYHWREGAGPLEKRPVGRDEYGREMKHFFGTLEFAKVAQAVGAEMMITANYKTGTPQEAANWVEFCNGEVPSPQPGWTERSFPANVAAPKGYFAWLRAQFGQAEPLSVMYWEIGNETLMHKDKGYLDKAVEYSRLMKAVDPTIQVGVVCESFRYMSEKDISKTAISREAFDFLVIHYYGSLKTRQPMTNFYSNGESARSFMLEKAGSYEIAVEAHGTRALEWPRMPLYVNGAIVEEFRVDSTAPATYKTVVQLPEGRNTLALRFLNDAVVPGLGDCNLFVKSVKLAAPGSKPVEVWNTPEHEYDWLFANNRLIEEHIGMVRRAFPDLLLAITEGNAGYGIIDGNTDREESRKLKASLWMAGLLNAMIRKDVAIFNQWLLSTSFMGFNLVAPDGNVTPSYHVLKMYSVHADRRRVDLSVASPTFDAPMLETTAFGKATTGNSYVDAMASYDERNGELAVTALNRHAKSPVQARIALGGLRLASPEATVETLNAKTGDGMEANNEKLPGNVAVRTRTVKVDGNGCDGIVIDLEPHSLTTVRCAVRR